MWGISRSFVGVTDIETETILLYPVPHSSSIENITKIIFRVMLKSTIELVKLRLNLNRVSYYKALSNVICNANVFSLNRGFQKV